jgi:hypothetical protein
MRFVLEETVLREYNVGLAFRQLRPAEKWCREYPYFNMVPMMRDLFIGGRGSWLKYRVTPVRNLRSTAIIGSKR